MDQKTLIFLVVIVILCLSSISTLSTMMSGEDDSIPKDEKIPGSIPKEYLDLAAEDSDSDEGSDAGSDAGSDSDADADEDPPSNITKLSQMAAGNADSDCVGGWGKWGDCTQTCSYDGSKGEKLRMYAVGSNSTGSGKACPFEDGEEQIRECGKISCKPVDCVGNWTAWSTEGSGKDAKEKRTWAVTQESKYGGAACSVEGSKRIETKATSPVDCVGGFGNWGDCSETCGDDGKKYRRYNVKTGVIGTGKDCPHVDGHMEEGECNRGKACGTDCVGSWSDWSKGKSLCKKEKINRSYKVETKASGTGKQCEYKDGDKEEKDYYNCPEGKQRAFVRMYSGKNYTGKDLFSMDGVFDNNKPHKGNFSSGGNRIQSFKISEGVILRFEQRYKIRRGRSRTMYVTVQGPYDMPMTAMKGIFTEPGVTRINTRTKSTANCRYGCYAITSGHFMTGQNNKSTAGKIQVVKKPGVYVGGPKKAGSFLGFSGKKKKTLFSIRQGQQLYIKGGKDGKYCADEGNTIRCNRSAVGGWEKFRFTRNSDGTYSFRGGKDGKWCADEGNTIRCNRGGIGGWEKFRITMNSDGTYSLKGGKDGKYCADEGNTIRCNRSAVGGWEKFRIGKI